MFAGPEADAGPGDIAPTGKVLSMEEMMRLAEEAQGGEAAGAGAADAGP